MPDWQNPQDYDFTSSLSSFRWVWEFLRRNPDYRRDFDSALERYLSKTGEFSADSPSLSELALSGGTMTFLLPEWSEDPSDPSFYLPVDEKDRWWLNTGLLNPDCDAPRFLGFRTGFGQVSYFNERMAHKLSPAGPHFPWAAFDLSLPLNPQIAAVHRELKHSQKLQKIKPLRPKHHRQLWPHYIRLLDADRDGRTPVQIANKLCVEPTHDGLDERKVWDQLQAAKKLTQPENYSTIFLSGT